MNNYSSNNLIKQYELNEAKKRMGTYTANSANAMTNVASEAGFTNTVGASNVTAQSQLKTSEKMQAQEDMNKNTMY